MTITRRGFIAAGGGLALGAPFLIRSAAAKQSVPLTVVSGFAPVTGIVKHIKESFMATVDQRLADTDYEIDWTEGFSGTIARPGGELEAIRTGVADVGVVVLPMHTDRVPIYRFSYVTPFVSGNLPRIVELHDEIVAKHQALRDAWNPYNQRVIGTSSVADTYHVLMRRPVRKPQDLDGQKILGIGPNLRWVTPLGAVGVNNSMADFYNSLQTGVGDGVIVWPEAIISLRLYEPANFVYKADTGTVIPYALNVNNNTWGRLPETVQQALEEAAPVMGKNLAEYQMTFRQVMEDRIAEAGGEVFTVPPEDRTEWANAIPHIAKEWVDETNAAGGPGDAIMTDWMDGHRATGDPIARNWDES